MLTPLRRARAMPRPQSWSGNAQLEALEIVERGDLPIGMHQTMVLAPEADRMHLAELIAEVGGGIGFERLRIHQRAARRHERQLEHFDFRKSAGACCSAAPTRYRRPRRAPDRRAAPARRRAASREKCRCGCGRRNSLPPCAPKARETCCGRSTRTRRNDAASA